MDPVTLYGASLASSVHGFLQGAWPFGVVELIWSGVAIRRWRARADVIPSGNAVTLDPVQGLQSRHDARPYL